MLAKPQISKNWMFLYVATLCLSSSLVMLCLGLDTKEITDGDGPTFWKKTADCGSNKVSWPCPHVSWKTQWHATFGTNVNLWCICGLQKCKPLLLYSQLIDVSEVKNNISIVRAYLNPFVLFIFVTGGPPGDSCLKRRSKSTSLIPRRLIKFSLQ